MNAITNVVHYDPAGLIFVCLGFEVAAAHRFVLQEMMSGPNNLLQLENKHERYFVTVARKTGGGVTRVLVSKPAELNLSCFSTMLNYVS